MTDISTPETGPDAIKLSLNAPVMAIFGKGQ